MVKRNRPRLTLTVDPDIKTKIKEIAADLSVPVSRLVEFIISEFLADYGNDKNRRNQLKNSIKEFKKSCRQKKVEQKGQQIEEILKRFDEIN